MHKVSALLLLIIREVLSNLGSLTHTWIRCVVAGILLQVRSICHLAGVFLVGKRIRERREEWKKEIREGGKRELPFFSQCVIWCLCLANFSLERNIG